MECGAEFACDGVGVGDGCFVVKGWQLLEVGSNVSVFGSERDGGEHAVGDLWVAFVWRVWRGLDEEEMVGAVMNDAAGVGESGPEDCVVLKECLHVDAEHGLP